MLQSAALSSATQHIMPPECDGKWGTECFNSRFHLPTLLCAGWYGNVKLILCHNFTIIFNDYFF